ncbi:hypothetical protein ACP70R_026988 [Stipagrostis hirtigluma subsp. patula]
MAPPPPSPPAFTGHLPREAPPRSPSNPNPPPSSPQDILFRAAFDGNLRLVKKTARALDKGEGRLAQKVGALRDSNGLGPLHCAAARGRMLVCQYLVDELRLDVNTADRANMTPLTFAIDFGNVDVVQYLLDHGADTEIRISTGLTPLVYAIGKGNCEIVKALLCKGANADALTTAGAALHFAAHNGRDDIVKILLDHHADYNKIAWGTNRPLVYAIYARSLKCVKLLIEAGADVQGIGTETPLALAATDGLTDILKCLVQAGADPNVRDGFGLTPIENAARYDRRKDVEILFPVTSSIPAVRDWSVDGIISHAKSLPALKTTFENLRSKIVEGKHIPPSTYVWLLSWPWTYSTTWDDEVLYRVMIANTKFQGREAVKHKDYFAAVEIYTKAMNLDPDDATLYSNRSLCWLRLGNGKKALTDAQACRMMRSSWSKACYREGAALMLLEDCEKACGAFLDGLKLEPENAEIKNALREALESMKVSRRTEKK